MCMKFEDFEYYMERLVKQIEAEKQIASGLTELGYYSSMFNITPSMDVAVELLCNDFDDIDESGSLIEFWLYDLNCGKEYEDGCYTTNDGDPIKIGTISELYDELVRRMVEKGEYNVSE